MQVAEAYFFHDYVCDFWDLTKQMGITDAVIPLTSLMEGPAWGVENLSKVKQMYENEGLRVTVIENMPPSNKIKLGLPGRDEEIEYFKTLIRSMGLLGIPVLCYNFMAEIGWFRTSMNMPTRGGALVSGYSRQAMEALPLTEYGHVSEEQMWDNLKYFLERIVPVAEEAKVKLALHPDDPPVTPLRGISRIIRGAEGLQRAIDLVPSPYSGITFCQGTLATAGEDIPSAIRQFGKQDKIFFVHFRDVAGTSDNFYETFHDDGKTDMLEAMKTYYEVGFNGPVRADHVPTMAGEPNHYPGYEIMGRLFGNGYMIGLMEAAGYKREKSHVQTVK
ncbi:mannonate dehydratase [Gorillibacterium sp. CAU 1737]|uniref:mannonate dehydratase n=1 Tax=Gorillibacterium sp. CAU 1737 TaxID=3140362 RepID=UPI0032615B3B